MFSFSAGTRSHKLLRDKASTLGQATSTNFPTSDYFELFYWLSVSTVSDIVIM